MGFGLLFLGLTLVLVMSGYAVLPAFIGYFLCTYACLKLSEYEEKFKRSAIVFAVVGVLSLAQSALQLTVLISGNTLLSDLAGYSELFFEAVFYIGQWMLLPALIAIARDTGRTKTVFACRRNQVLFILMFVLYIAANILVRTGWTYSRWALVYAIVSRFIVLILNLVSVFSCYMWICREGEEEEEESRLNAHFSKIFRKKEPEPAEPELPKWRKDRERRKRRK